MLSKKKFYIDGCWVQPNSNKKLEIINPSNSEVFAEVTLGDANDLDLAVAAAKQALIDWGQTSITERRAYLDKLLVIYKSRATELAELISKEMGAPISLAKSAQVGSGIAHLKQAIKSLDEFAFQRTIPNGDTYDNLFFQPIGVVGLITPWNWPMNQIMLKVAPAIASGCTMILKPSEIAPLSAMLLAEMIDEADVPAGVFNLINGDGEGIGEKMSSHPEIDMISFTGSTRAGRKIMQSAAYNIKHVSLELGGKGANIVFSDADEKAVGRGVRQCFLNSGQSCNAPTRMIIEQQIYESAIEQAKIMAAKIEVGPSEIEGRHIGPVVSKAQFDKIQSLIELGITEGARLICGGRGQPEGMKGGYFVKPTIFADVTPDMTIFKKEIFGPVLCMSSFLEEQEAIRKANDTTYGLTNFIQTSDMKKANRVASQLKSGMVEVNGRLLSPASPFSGHRQSGNGTEGGIFGLQEYLVPKAVSGLSN